MSLYKTILLKSIKDIEVILRGFATVAKYKFNGNNLFETDYFYSKNKNILYIAIPKCANSAIKRSILISDGIDVPTNFHGWHDKAKKLGYRNLSDVSDETMKFTVVRNPFERLVSMYINKFSDASKIADKKFLYKKYLGGILELDMSFDKVVNVIYQIPDNVSDGHFKSQSSMLEHYKDVEVIKLEELSSKYKLLSDKYELVDLEFINKSASYDYRDYYNLQTLELVRKRYSKDIEQFDYNHEYEKLKEYVISKHH